MSTAPSWLANGFSSGAFCGGCERWFCPPWVFVPFWLLCPCEPLFEPLESRNSTLEAFTFVISRLLPSLSWNLSTLSEPCIPIFDPFWQYCSSSWAVLPHASTLMKCVVSFLKSSLTAKFMLVTTDCPAFLSSMSVAMFPVIATRFIIHYSLVCYFLLVLCPVRPALV